MRRLLLSDMYSFQTNYLLYLQVKRLETDRAKGNLVKSFLWPREVPHDVVSYQKILTWTEFCSNSLIISGSQARVVPGHQESQVTWEDHCLSLSSLPYPTKALRFNATQLWSSYNTSNLYSRWNHRGPWRSLHYFFAKQGIWNFYFPRKSWKAESHLSTSILGSWY